jgi:hypothetical protein
MDTATELCQNTLIPWYRTAPEHFIIILLNLKFHIKDPDSPSLMPTTGL